MSWKNRQAENVHPKYDLMLIIIPLRLIIFIYMLFQSIRLLFQYFHIISILFQEVCNSHKPNFAHRSQWVRVHILCWKFALLGVLLLFVQVYTCCKPKWHAMYPTFLLLRLRMAVGSSMFVLCIDEVFLQPTPNQITRFPLLFAISVGKWCIFVEIGWTHLESVWSRVWSRSMALRLEMYVECFWSLWMYLSPRTIIQYGPLATMCLSQESISHPLAGWWFQAF
jgi:hypothetical protein